MSSLPTGIPLVNIILRAAGPVSTFAKERTHVLLPEAGKLACNVRGHNFAVGSCTICLPPDSSIPPTPFAVSGRFCSFSSLNAEVVLHRQPPRSMREPRRETQNTLAGMMGWTLFHVVTAFGMGSYISTVFIPASEGITAGPLMRAVASTVDYLLLVLTPSAADRSHLPNSKL